MKKLIEIPELVFTDYNKDIRGKQAFICQDQDILKEVCEYYGRNPEKLCIKVFHGNPLKEGETLDDALWGDNHNPSDPNAVRKNTKLMDGTRIQNICWIHGKAPRVYAVFEALYKGQRVACQLTDFAEGSFAPSYVEVTDLHKYINALGNKYGFEEVKNILSLTDLKGGKIVDVQQYAFTKDHEDKIRETYFNRGRYGKVYYQDVPELGLHGGPRKSEDRIEYMKLDRIDFKDKVVWDVGSAGGFFARYAADRGAKRVIGFDEVDPCFAAFMVSNYLKYFNVDFDAVDLKEDIPAEYEKPDIVFYLSMNFHIPTPKRIFEADTLIFEDNGKETRHLEEPSPEFTFPFPKWKFVGRGEDHGNKSVYHLFK